jgi:hypothetical protein
MSIINSSNQFLQAVAPAFPRKVHKLLVFGYRALSIQRIQSLNSNARSTVANTKTAESKAYRLGGSNLLRRAFPQLISRLGLVRDGDIIAVDFSDFGLVQVLMFAKQTREGRALPIWFAVLPYGWTKETSQNAFVVHALEQFMHIVGCPVGFVFDRGFACPTITGYLARHKVTLYQRIRGDKKLLGHKGGKKAREFGAGCHPIWVYGHRMNLVVTPEPDVRLKTSGKAKEPWFIVTNDLEASAAAVTDIYYHRFEIEEVFKDAKRLFGLEWMKFKIPERLVTVLWFVVLGFWLHAYLETTLQASREVVQKTKQSFGQGRTHYWLEKTRYELQASALAMITIQANRT